MILQLAVSAKPVDHNLKPLAGRDEKMKKIYAIVVLCLIVSVPVWAGQVYTNSSLKKYDIYKSPTNIKNSASKSMPDTATATADKAENQGKIEITSQKMSWGKSNNDGTGKNYSWQVELTNKFTVDKQVNIEFNLIDKEGTVLSVANGTGNIDPNKTEIFKGTGVIKSELAPQAVRSSVQLTAK
jgi:hypothetical protein